MATWKKVTLWTLAVLTAFFLLKMYPVSSDGINITGRKPGFYILGNVVANYFIEAIGDGEPSKPYYMPSMAKPGTPVPVVTPVVPGTPVPAGSSSLVRPANWDSMSPLEQAKWTLQPCVGPVKTESIGGKPTKVQYLTDGRKGTKIHLSQGKDPAELLPPPGGLSWQPLEKGDGTFYHVVIVP